ncbi:MAG: hypothetical protein IPG01_13160 [Chitinophagaceae bacterium]|jgi:hypothetical protein|nr:hypothetical protein [Chitinophagaceae bacterium]
MKDHSIAEQAASLRSKYPQYKVTSTHVGLKVLGNLQPTARSSVYAFELRYSLSISPEVKILSPALVRNWKGSNIPHTYPGNKLCLFRPIYGEFKRSDFIYETIIPWVSLWLYHYEVWHTTDTWYGGGEHPQIKFDNA